MVWNRASILLLCGVAMACGPDGVAAPETDGETEDSGSSTTGDASNSGSATNPTASASASATNASNSGSATTTATNPTASASATATDDGPMDTSADDPSETMPTTTDECPFGTEGCLCDVGAECDEGLFCNDDGVCEAPPDCRPLDTDPHGDEDSAYELEELGCGDDSALGVIGTIQGPETDWYTYYATEAFMCQEQPGGAVAANVDLEVCVFIECVEGNAGMINCADGSSDADSPDGRPGCCGTNAAQFQSYDCLGMFAGKDINVWLAVRSDDMICEDYSLEYSQ